MSQGDITVTVTGNLTADPELRFTPAGQAVANFTVASTPRKFDRDSNEWKDGEATFLRVNVWRQQAENVAESLEKGARVTVTGVLQQRRYETKEGEKRSSYEITADDVSCSLKFATAKVTRAARGGSGRTDDPASDPWGTGGGGDGPPF